MTEVTIHPVKEPDKLTRYIVVCMSGEIEKRFDDIDAAVDYCIECDYTYEIV